jgi:signal transduction histidine kinase
MEPVARCGVGEHWGVGGKKEPGAIMRLEHAPTLRESAARGALAVVAGYVLDHGTSVSAHSGCRPCAGSAWGDAAAARACHELDIDWVVCSPIAVPGGDALGTITVLGRSFDGSGAPEPIEELGRLAAHAIVNGRAYAGAMAAVRGREQILALVAHELKNPLGVILMGAANALEPVTSSDCACAPPHPRRELEVIQRSARRMKRLVGDLLDLASIDAGSFSMPPAWCNATSVIGEAIRDAMPLATSSGVSLLEDLETDLPAVPIDGERLTQVLLNLIVNAVKFTSRGGRVRVRASVVGDTELVVAVEDSGCGIAAKDLPRIFDRFWQASEGTRPGTGLGLAICKSIVELVGGRIWAESTPRVGTTMYFALPLTNAS